ncbi:cysteine hydrolase family protein [Xanthomonas hortorum]|uniref:Peroxyureidoacrylate/ureidoacrylate amidohydrolase RutB n=1 Tax=Xanthomonas hortorum pv. gardneri TaxID=2754056 RepID=A0A6V7ERL3_9XANT|nr:cysteine hydrolase family protein [Xanthomonas hortorum]KQQ84152.1 Isochorismatase [Xanthomonas sp. Leaf131]MCC4624675.1 cysteine hydrolase [Xanthomonas campestris pv. nigromaculans]APP79237.1 cysteine hydrolase [Xanthomonas hortorum pv. gardneri]EGD19975.1 nicotinamidase-like amidase [Xanthomonas hortorum ATCC 19865]KLA92882.1 Isochorismatase [Xanthomonas hortorum pv. gardneri]
MSKGIIVIDLQNDYFPGGKMPLSGIEQASANAALVVGNARSQATPVFHVRHEATAADAPFFVAGSHGAQIRTGVEPQDGEVVIVKQHINAFRDTDLQQQLQRNGVDEVVVVGAMSHMCVDACVRAAADMGYSVTVLHDACATMDLSFDGVTTPAAQVHAAMMAALQFGYAAVHSTQSYLQHS